MFQFLTPTKLVNVLWTWIANTKKQKNLDGTIGIPVFKIETHKYNLKADFE